MTYPSLPEERIAELRANLRKSRGLFATSYDASAEELEQLFDAADRERGLVDALSRIHKLTGRGEGHGSVAATLDCIVSAICDMRQELRDDEADIQKTRLALQGSNDDMRQPGETVAEVVAGVIKERDELRARVAKLEEALALDTPWPVWGVLNKLADAADTLLVKLDYDVPGWEEIVHARTAARRIAKALVQP